MFWAAWVSEESQDCKTQDARLESLVHWRDHPLEVGIGGDLFPRRRGLPFPTEVRSWIAVTWARSAALRSVE